MMPGKLNRLLKLRQEMNRRRPRFVRMNSWMLKRLDDSWRSPRHSLDNKIRLERKGFPPRVKIGYRGPSEVRGLHPSGLTEVLVSTPSQLKELNPHLHIVRIASSVGKKKRAEIIRLAQEKGLKIANP
ncbi:MAG: 50S ribosomal protein L32e [Thermofilaceae archaeon]